MSKIAPNDVENIKVCSKRHGDTYMFTERIIIRVLDFVEIVLVKLTNKARKVRVPEHVGDNHRSESVYIFDDETISAGGPT